MMRWVDICLLVVLVTVWGAVSMAGWLIVGPWWLAKRVVHRCANVGRPIGGR